MSFKIVKTIDSGKLCSWTVPECWESDGILRCPKFRFEELRREPFSVPQETWQVIDCVRVKSNLQDFEAAEAEIRRENAHNATPNEASVNQEVIEELLSKILAESAKARALRETIAVIGTPCIDELTTSQYSELITKTNALSTMVPKMAKDQGELIQTQILILKKFSELYNRFNEFMRAHEAPEEPRYTGLMKIINDKKSFDDFELSLECNRVFREWKKTLSVVCSKGKRRGINNAFRLMYEMFDLEFLWNFSWAGTSRDDVVKFRFKSYRNTINLFFQIIHSSDRNFTVTDCTEFLKLMLENARICIKYDRFRHPQETDKTNHLSNKSDEGDNVDNNELIEQNNVDVKQEQNITNEEAKQEAGEPIIIEQNLQT